jgi:hypothetical protein
MDTQTTSSYHHRRVVIKMVGNGKQICRLFALFCRERGNVSIAEVR